MIDFEDDAGIGCAAATARWHTRCSIGEALCRVVCLGLRSPGDGWPMLTRFVFFGFVDEVYERVGISTPQAFTFFGGQP
jgi:hypothetical protein